MVLENYYHDYSGIFLFLTPDGRKPNTDNNKSKFKCYNISYKDLLEPLSLIKDIDSISNCVYIFIENIKENIAMDNKNEKIVYEIWGNRENRDKLKIIFKNRPTIQTIKTALYNEINQYLMTKGDEIDENRTDEWSNTELHLRVKSLNENNIPITFMFYDWDNRENTPSLRIVLYGADFDKIPKERIKEYKEKHDFLAFEKVKNWSGPWYALYTGKSLEADFSVTENHDYGESLVNILFTEFKKEYEKIMKII